MSSNMQQLMQETLESALKSGITRPRELAEVFVAEHAEICAEHANSWWFQKVVDKFQDLLSRRSRSRSSCVAVGGRCGRYPSRAAGGFTSTSVIAAGAADGRS